jgi:hypothetical protein
MSACHDDRETAFHGPSIAQIGELVTFIRKAAKYRVYRVPLRPTQRTGKCTGQTQGAERSQAFFLTLGG